MDDESEVWHPDRVELTVAPAVWRHSAITWLAFALLVAAIGFDLAFYSLLPKEGQVGVWTVAGYALLGLPVPGLPVALLVGMRAFEWLDQPSKIEVGADRLVIDGQAFRRLEVRSVQLTGARIVVTRIDGTSWRSAHLSGLDSPRLTELLGDFGCALEDGLEEAREGERVREQLRRAGAALPASPGTASALPPLRASRRDAGTSRRR